MTKTVSEIVVDTLIKAGAQRCYGIVGDTINHFTNALHKSSLRWVHVRHEEVGGFAAGGDAYMTGELTICAGTTGPGTLHFVNGLFESHRNGAPVVLIASNIDRTQAGLSFPQDVDQRKIYEQTSVFCEYISHPDQARRVTALAAQAALTRNGVAVVIVNGDMFKETSDDELQWSVNRSKPVIFPDETNLQHLNKLINEAGKITIYAGYGARNAHDDVVALAEKLQAPVVHSTRAKEFIEPQNPYNVGMTGILGNKAGMEAVLDCDLMLCLGTDFAYTQFYPEKGKVVQIDIAPENIGRRAPVHLGLVGDVADTIGVLLPLVTQRKDSKHLEKAKKQWQEDLQEYADAGKEPDDTLIHPQFVAHTLDRLAAPDAIFTADGGSPMVWSLRHLRVTVGRRFLCSLLHGTMANAYPQAMGIACAYPDRQVIAMCGDGGFTMLMGDIITLAQEKIPVKLLIFNNGSLGFVEMEQRVDGLLDVYTDLQNPDFSKIAQTCGLYGAQVDRASDLESAMTKWLAHDGPALLEVKVSRMELVMPPKIEANQVASMALFGIRAVLNGRTNEVYSLLRDNFLR